MTSLVTVIPKTLTMPIWVVYKRDKQAPTGWTPVSAFLSQSEAHTWSSRELGAVPHLTMDAFTPAYASRSPCVVTVSEDGQKFTVDMQGIELPVVDLNDLPSALPAIVAVLQMLTEHRKFYNDADKADYHRFRSILRTLTDDDFLMAPKKHRN